MSFGYRLLGFGAFPSRGAGPFNTGLIGNSLLMNGSDESLDKTFGSAPGSQSGKRYIWATWVQPFVGTSGTVFTMWSAGTSGSNAYSELSFYNQQSTRGDVEFNSYNGGSSYDYRLRPTQRFRDNGWQHFLISYDSTQALASNRVQMYYNGEQIASFAQADYPSLNHVDFPGTAVDHRIGCRPGGSGGGFYKNYTTQHVFLDSQSIQNGDVAITDFLDIFTFGTNGTQFAPKADADIAALATTAGHNSFCLDFSDNTGTNAANLGNDISDNNNDFSTNNLGTSNRVNHTPSKMFATWNQIQGKFPSTSGSLQVPTLTEGNLRAAISSSNRGAAISSLLMPAGSGKFAAKFTINTITGINPTIGVFDMDTYASTGGNAFTGSSDSVALRMDGERYLDGSSASYGSAVSAGNTVEVELDMDNNTVEFLINGSAQGTISKTFTGNVGFMADCGTNSGATDVTAEFDYTPDDSNFKTLNTANLTAPSFQGIDYFDNTIYQGTGNGLRLGDFVPFTDAYSVTNSAIFNDNDSRGLSKTFGGSGDRRTMTFSTWVKWTNPAGSGQQIFGSGTDNNNRFQIQFATADNITLFSKVSGSTILNLGSKIEITDMSDWVNIVVSIDTDQSSTAERFRLFVDGVQYDLDVTTDTLGGGNGSADSGDLCHLNSGVEHNIGRHGNGSAYFDGYLAETVFIDGSRLDASSFGQLDAATNRWIPKDVSGLTFGTNGFYLEYQGDFSSESLGNDAGKDTSGQGNHFALEGTWAQGDKVVDAPTKNYAIYDSVQGFVYTEMAFTEGRLTTKSGNGSHAISRGFPIQDGYWYYEVNVIDDVNNMLFGLCTTENVTVTASTSSPSITGIQVNGTTEVIQNDGDSNSVGGPTLTNPSAGDVIGIYIRKAGNNYGMWFSLNGTAMSNTPAATATATPDLLFNAVKEMAPAAHYSNPGDKEAQTNFGQLLYFDGGATSFNADSDGYWKHAPVSGFKALNSDNLSATASKVTAWAWIKNREADDSHIFVDRVRGVGNVLHSDSTAAETTDAASQNTVQRFFQRGVRIGNDVQVNTYNEAKVLWQWLVGESASTATTTSPAGSIASTSIVADAGHFSIINYTGNATSGATIGHGLPGAPEMIWIKERDNSNGWIVGHDDVGFTKILRLDTTDDETDDSGAFNNTAPSSTVITLGSNNGTNRDGTSNGNQMICYAFRSVPGVCKVGSYVGNNDADGFFVNLGFKPAFVISKPYSTTGSWMIIDNERSRGNPMVPRLFPNSNATEDEDGEQMDFLSNGFKLRKTGGHNGTASYIYMAMAEIGGFGTLPPIYGY